ncbi:hypothetical protein ACFQ67_00235 [Streptomyces sp. NPDC056488]|uniref:hypothetical protein n=1 Tax=Streptomyces sp. NPDC056488 TaxID=3345836 RepID=UPI0036779BF6
MTTLLNAHCGWTEFHAGHSFLRLEVLFQCPGTPAAQPEPAQPRHTADSITDDALTALYEQLDAAQQTELARQLTTCDKAFASATLRAARASARAEKAEAAIERVRQHCAPDQNTKSLGYLRGSKDILALLGEAGPTRAEAERDAARNTLGRVRAVADEWAKTAQRYPDSRLSTETVAYVIRTTPRRRRDPARARAARPGRTGPPRPPRPTPHPARPPRTRRRQPAHRARDPEGGLPVTGPNTRHLPKGWHDAGPTLATLTTQERVVLDEEPPGPERRLNRAERRAATRALARKKR